MKKFVLSVVVATAAVAALALSCGSAAKTCGPGNCSGCCDVNGQCQTGNSTTACGFTGGACTACVGNQVCSGGYCVSFGGTGGGTGGGAGGGVGGGAGGGVGGGTGSGAPGGAACSASTDCYPGDGGSPCYTAYAGGFCFEACGNNADCIGAWDFCVGNAACVQRCDPGAPPCRTNYACQPQADGGTPYCLPRCDTGGYTCSSTTVCGADGLCH